MAIGANGPKIMDCEIIKPSGSPSGTVTDEDMAAAEDGHEFVFDLSQEPIRYLRIVILNTWEGPPLLIPQKLMFMVNLLNNILKLKR